MTKKAPSVSDLIDKLGGPVKVAAALEISNPSIVWNWRKRNSVPADRATALAKLAGIPREQLRPDIFGELA